MAGHLIKTCVALGLVLAPASAPAIAQQPAPECPATPVLPAQWLAWATPQALGASSDVPGLSQAILPVGTAVQATLTQTSSVSYVVEPEKPGGTVSYGGMFIFDVREEGTYSIALGSGAWIDVLDGTTAVASTTHGHGPACSTIRKMVDFPLKPGRYTLQLVANGLRSMTVMIARQP